MTASTDGAPSVLGVGVAAVAAVSLGAERAAARPLQQLGDDTEMVRTTVEPPQQVAT